MVWIPAFAGMTVLPGERGGRARRTAEWPRGGSLGFCCIELLYLTKS